MFIREMENIIICCLYTHVIYNITICNNLCSESDLKNDIEKIGNQTHSCVTGVFFEK